MRNKVKILLVENSGADSWIRTGLNHAGYIVQSAVRVQDAREILSKEKIDCILLDSQIPDCAGVIKKLKSDVTPIIMLADSGKKEDVIIWLEAGADDYADKPAGIEIILVRLKAVLRMKYLNGAFIQADKTITELKEQSVKDGLTGLYNHKYFHEVLNTEISRATRGKYNICCCMIDIDCYKQINDNYGHAFGDFILKEVSMRIKESSRQEDILIRYGGDEFAVLLIDTDYTGAFSVAERLRSHIEAYNFEYLGISVKLTASIGIASLFEDRSFSKDRFVSSADRALYEAKLRGRNNIVIYKELAVGMFLNAPSLLRMEKRIYSIAEYAKKNYIDSLKIMIFAWEKKRQYTRKHSLNVFKYVRLITDETNLPKNEIEAIENAAILHDLGKLLISEDILFKDKLTQKECEIIKKHSTLTISLLSKSGFMKKELPIILHHHERFDGSGYPMGLKGKYIPLGSRIIAVADAYVNFMSFYRNKPVDYREIINKLLDGAGAQFDPEIVKIFLKALYKKRLLPRNMDKELR